MKAARILCLCTAIALPQLALAGESTNPTGLGIVDAVLDSCTRIDPRGATRFESLKVSVALGESGLRKTDAYKDAYQRTIEALEKIPRADMVKYCAAGATSIAPAPPEHRHDKDDNRR